MFLHGCVLKVFLGRFLSARSLNWPVPCQCLHDPLQIPACPQQLLPAVHWIPRAEMRGVKLCRGSCQHCDGIRTQPSRRAALGSSANRIGCAMALPVQAGARRAPCPFRSAGWLGAAALSPAATRCQRYRAEPAGAAGTELLRTALPLPALPPCSVMLVKIQSAVWTQRSGCFLTTDNTLLPKLFLNLSEY